MKLILFILSVCLFTSSQASLAESPFPLTKNRIRKLLQRPPNSSTPKLKLKTYQGCVSVPAKSFLQNLFVGERLTGETCSITVKPNNIVAISFLGNMDIPLAYTGTAEYPTDIFLNEIQRNGLVIVQHVQGSVVSVTHTVYDKKGYVVYGGYGKGKFIKSCVFGVEKATGHRSCSK